MICNLVCNASRVELGLLKGQVLITPPSPLKPLSPVVAGSSALKLQCAKRVCDVLNGVTQAVCEVVAGVDAPLVSSHGVLNILDPVGSRQVSKM